MYNTAGLEILVRMHEPTGVAAGAIPEFREVMTHSLLELRRHIIVHVMTSSTAPATSAALPTSIPLRRGWSTHIHWRWAIHVRIAIHRKSSREVAHGRSVHAEPIRTMRIEHVWRLIHLRHHGTVRLVVHIHRHVFSVGSLWRKKNKSYTQLINITNLLKNYKLLLDSLTSVREKEKITPNHS